MEYIFVDNAALFGCLILASRLMSRDSISSEDRVQILKKKKTTLPNAFESYVFNGLLMARKKQGRENNVQKYPEALS